MSEIKSVFTFFDFTIYNFILLNIVNIKYEDGTNN